MAGRRVLMRFVTPMRTFFPYLTLYSYFTNFPPYRSFYKDPSNTDEELFSYTDFFEIDFFIAKILQGIIIYIKI